MNIPLVRAHITALIKADRLSTTGVKILRNTWINIVQGNTSLL